MDTLRFPPPRYKSELHQCPLRRSLDMTSSVLTLADNDLTQAIWAER